MRQPSKNASVRTLFLYGRFVARAADRNGHIDVRDLVAIASQSMRQAERDYEDFEVSLEEAICDRIFADGALDDKARVAKRQIDARGPRAFKEAPSILIYPNGLQEYVEAPIIEQRPKYTLLIDRIESSLDPTDPVRVETVPALKEALDDWLSAWSSVDAATSDLDRVRGDRNAAVVAWGQAILKAYGMLLSRMSKESAERYFPKSRKPADKESETPETPEPPAQSAPAS